MREVSSCREALTWEKCASTLPRSLNANQLNAYDTQGNTIYKRVGWSEVKMTYLAIPCRTKQIKKKVKFKIVETWARWIGDM